MKLLAIGSRLEASARHRRIAISIIGELAELHARDRLLARGALESFLVASDGRG